MIVRGFIQAIDLMSSPILCLSYLFENKHNISKQASGIVFVNPYSMDNIHKDKNMKRSKLEDIDPELAEMKIVFDVIRSHAMELISKKQNKKKKTKEKI